MKHKNSYVKKCIAGVLTIALAAGVCQSYGSIEASAQEMTLPGIQQLVQEKQTQGDTFHILEIVADKSNASIGYLIGGEEPVSEGRKLSELPAASERNKTMQELQSQVGTENFKDLIGNGPVSRLDPYQEGSGSRTEDIRGSFVARGTQGRYNYVTGGSAYRMLQDTEDPQGQTRYDRKSTVEATNGTNAVMQGVIPTFTKWTSATMVMRVENGTEVTEAYAADRYSLQYYNGENGSMNITNPAEFVPRNYIGRAVYAEQVSGSITSYRYLGTIVQGDPSSASVENSENASGVTRSLSDNDPAAATASGNDPGITTQSGTSANLYVYNRSTASSVLWAKKVGETYTFEQITDGKFLYFDKDANGEYYVSKVSCVSDADFRLSDVYKENPAGRYVKVGNGTTTVKVQGIDADFIAQDTYDFIGDNSKNVFETVTYSGGFYNKEWFKKEVLNLSGSSRYEKDTDYSGEVNDFNIEVTTLTLAQLAELTATDSQAYYGINLDDVDLIYLSGRGSYAAESVNMTSAATALTKMIFGIKDTTGERNNADRVPVVMDYGFYSQNKTLAEEPNNNQNNKILTQMALTILKVSDDSIAKEVASQGDAYWNNGQTVASLSLGDSVKEALYDNVYLNDDSATPYVASDFLTDCKGNAAKAATFGAVLKEIQYENFLAKKNNNNAAQMVEEISKASITRYILNWYMHRTTVKSELNVLDLQPSYDFDKKGKVLTEDQVKTFMGMPDYTSGNIHITHTTSAEFIGKIEDLNEKYDLIYLGDYIGGMNTETKNGKTTTKFNDTAMNGLIYYHVGDEYSYSKEADDDKARLRDDSLNHSDNIYRGPGNDINSTRCEEFKQYIDAGYPVILADQYVTTSGGYYVADTKKLDINSYFYKLVQYALSTTDQGQYKFWQKNVFTQSQLSGEVSGLGTELKDRQSAFCNYLNLSKLTMTWVEGLEASAYPVALNYGKDGQNTAYLKSESGDYVLRYVFTLQNDSALSLTGTTYDCKLFVDRNADGRFSGSDYVPGKITNTSEELTGLKVYVRNGSEWERLEQVQDASGNYGYALQTGKVYRLERTLPGDYVGVIPWKLVFYDNSDKLVRTAKSGYTAVPIGTKKIKILQIVSEDDNEWNLGQELKDESGLFYEYTKDLDGWEIEVDSRTVSQIMQEIKDAEVPGPNQNKGHKYELWYYPNNDKYMLSNVWYQDASAYMEKYNMLILGFADNYQFGKTISADEAKKWETNEYGGADIAANIAFARAVRDYIESGKSVLFTHDASSYVNSISAIGKDWSWGYEFNKTIRAAVGLDRYGALKEYYSRMANSSNVSAEEKQRYLDYLKTLENYDYDEIKQPGGNTELGQKEGLTRYTAVRFLRKQLKALSSNSSTSFCFPIRNDLLRDAWYGNSKAKKKSKNALFGEYTNGDTENDKNNNNKDLANCMTASLVNEGQITQYPYQIGKTLSISNTHYQWLQPNMELDRDNDGKCDIVVWYCLGAVEGTTKDIYNILPNDVVNNYYIYNMGNVTYSGAGHSKPKSAAEAKLFINTMVAAYNAGISVPSVSFQDAQGNKITSTYMIYDPVNKMILKTENQGDRLSVRFRAEDNNVLTGDPQVCVEFYKSAEDGDTGVVEINGQKMVPLKAITVKDSSGNSLTASDGHYVVNNSSMYVLEYPLSEVGLFDDASMTLKTDAGAETIYAYVYTLYDNGRKTTAGSTAGLSVSAQELFDLN
ncbi:MAG: DUF5057 domain-containing protein [Lachnospiraceae bacterium]|nr:DUF5057 domain-containing protein [Lachnospiraceae bacterium]